MVARRDAVHALFGGYDKVKEALSRLADDMEQTAETRLEASKHCKTMDKLETAILFIHCGMTFSPGLMK